MTAQFGEILTLEGEERRMQFCPPLPSNTPGIVINPDPESVHSSTACWRGYIGVWEIEGDGFYLKDIRAPGQSGLPAVLFKAPERIPATWFSGVLRLPRGEMLRYVHMGFASVFEEEEHIKIEKGVVVARRRIDNRHRVASGELPNRSGLPGTENLFDGDDW